jgi:phytoene synthase
LPPDVRPAFATLWNLDLSLADVVATTTEPRLGAIRLAWWRERLEELDGKGPSPGEPRLSAIARQLVERGISGKLLAQLEDGWLPLLEPFPWGDAQAEGFRLRGRILFGIGAQLLGGDRAEAEAAGAVWSLVDGALHCSDRDSRDFLLADARLALKEIRSAPRRVRSLTVLAALAAKDLDAEGGLGRVAAAFMHRLTGRFPTS